jgi:hypothetical protein
VDGVYHVLMVTRRKRDKYKAKSKETIIKGGFKLTDFDKITYLYKIKSGEYVEVTNVSYEVIINNKPKTIVRYDSSHGYLHRHITVSLEDDSEILADITKQGSHHDWLTIAVEDIKENFLEYRRDFFERSGIEDSNG